MLNGKRALLITLQYIFTFSASQIHLIVSKWCWCKQFFLFFSFDVASHVVDVIFFLICWHVFCDVGFTSGYLWLWYLWDLMEICVFFVCGYFPFEIIKYRLNNIVYPENGFFSVHVPVVDFPVAFWGEPQCTGESQWMLYVGLFHVANVWTHQPN